MPDIEQQTQQPTTPAAEAAPVAAPAASPAPGAAPGTEAAQTKSLHDAVAAAYDKAEKSSTAPAAPGAKPRDPATGQFLAAKAAAAAPAKPAAPAVKPDAAAEAAPGEKPADEAAGAKMVDRPPQSWRAGAKAQWAKLPPEVKADVMRLERERETVLRETAGARRVAESFNEVVRPYEGFIRAAGHTPLQSVSELMKTAAALRVGSEWDKAVLAASIVRAHNINPELVLSVLAGDGPIPGSQQPQQPQEFRDPRVDELLGEIRAGREQAMSAAAEAADVELDDFIVKHPLAEDPEVQQQMAEFVEVAASRGVDLSYEDAYTRVLAMDPDLRSIDDQQRQASAANPAGSTQRAELAASSIAPSPVVRAPVSLKGRSIYDHAAAAYDKHAGRV